MLAFEPCDHNTNRARRQAAPEFPQTGREIVYGRNRGPSGGELASQRKSAFTKSAQRSPIMIDGAFVLPETSRGITDASAT